VIGDFMKIGILTFHIAHNYGAVLQCYALQETLRSKGHEVYVIDYQQPFIVNHFRPRFNMGLRSFCKSVLDNDIKNYLYLGLLPYIKTWYFYRFRKKYFHLTKKCYNVYDIPPMDLYIIGSDQPWNPDLTGGADIVYFGQFNRPEHSRMITYAMSGAENSLSKVGWDNIHGYCSKFDSLSFREESITRKISSIIGRECTTCLDPTLIVDKTLWRPLIDSKWSGRKYILLYHVGGPKDIISRMTAKAYQISKSEGMELIDASKYLYSPSDFVSLIRYASFVVTASFHAMVFAIIFNTPFNVVRTGQASDGRFINILSQLEIPQYLVEADNLDINTPPCNCNEQLRILKRGSLEYISNAL